MNDAYLTVGIKMDKTFEITDTSYADHSANGLWCVQYCLVAATGNQVTSLYVESLKDLEHIKNIYKQCGYVEVKT